MEWRYRPYFVQYFRNRPATKRQLRHSEASAFLRELRLDREARELVNELERDKKKRRHLSPIEDPDFPPASDLCDLMRENWRKWWEKNGKPPSLYLAMLISRRWGEEQVEVPIEAWKQLVRDEWLPERAMELAQKQYEKVIKKFKISDEDLEMENRALRETPWLHQLLREFLEEERPWREVESYLATFERLAKSGDLLKRVDEDFVKGYVQSYRKSFEQGWVGEVKRAIEALEKCHQDGKIENGEFIIWQMRERLKIPERWKQRQGNPLLEAKARLMSDALDDF